MSPNGFLAAPNQDFDWQYIEPVQITLGGRVFGDPTTVFEKATAAEVGFYDPDFENENPLWYRLLARSKGAVLGKILYYHRWRLNSVSRGNLEANSRMHLAVRRRYDAGNAELLKANVPFDERGSLLTKGRRGVFCYLDAGDHVAARELAIQLWQRMPWTLSANRLLFQAAFGVKRFRIWQKKRASLMRINPQTLTASGSDH
jgi:hypothetical protein